MSSIALKTSIGAVWLATVAFGLIVSSDGFAQEKKHEYRNKDVPVLITLEDVTLDVLDRNKKTKSFNLGQGNLSLPRLLPLKQKAIDLTASQGKNYEARVTGLAVNTGKRPVGVLIRMAPVRRLHPEDEIGEGFHPEKIDRQGVVINPGKQVALFVGARGLVRAEGFPDADGYRQYFRVSIQAYNDDDPVEAGISNVMSTTTAPFVTKPRDIDDGKIAFKLRPADSKLRRNTARMESPGAGWEWTSILQGEQQDKDAELKALLKERSELLAKSVKKLTLRYRAGYVSWEELARVQREALRAALDLAEGPKARLAVLRELKANADGAFKVAEASFAVGIATEDQMLQAKAMVLEIRAAILKEEAKMQ
jgi:hypothetical protein